MAGIKALRKLQFGAEASTDPGTDVAATTVMRMSGTIRDTRQTVFVEEEVGYLPGLDRTYVPILGGELTMTGPATFEQLPYVLEAGVMLATPSATDGGSANIYEYTMPTTAVKTPRTYTIEGGDNIAAEQMVYSFVSQFQLSGNAGEAWQVSATWAARQVSTCAFTTLASSDVPTVEEMLVSKSKLYLDVSTDAPGTTQVSQTLLSATINVTTGFTAVNTADGQLYFSFVKQAMPEVTVQVTFEHNASAQAEKDYWRAQTPRNLRLLCTGNALTSAGSVYSLKTFIFDLAGKWESFDAISDQNGNDIVTGTFRGRPNRDAGYFGDFTVVNNLAALP